MQGGHLGSTRGGDDDRLRFRYKSQKGIKIMVYGTPGCGCVCIQNI
jgi:hypothetical protein